MANDRPLSLRLELITAVTLLLLIVLMRAYHLDADPPDGLSVSSDVETDPSQYTLFAKNYIQDGDFDPFDDTRRSVFLKSTVTAVSVVAFDLFGIGILQSNLVGLLLGIGALVFFWLFIRRAAGPVAGLLFLFLAAFNNNLIFYGKLPFLEHSLALFAFLAATIIVYARRDWWMLPAGISLAVGIFFGKAIGLVLLLPFACFFVYRALFPDKIDRRSRWMQPAYFAAGFTVVLVVWFFVTYLPSQSQVSGYYGEQAVGLYGGPEGLESVDKFVRKLVTFGDSSLLFPRMGIVALVGVVFLLIVLYHVTRRRSWKDGFGRLTAGHIFLAVMIVGTYAALMIWNYRPLRYQLLLIYPFYGAAAVVLAMLFRRPTTGEPVRVSWLWFIPATVVLMVPIYQLWDSVAPRLGIVFSYDTHKWWSLLAAVGLSIAIKAFLRLQAPPVSRRLGIATRLAVVLVLIAGAYSGLKWYSWWAERPTFTAVDNSRDLGMVLNPGAVVSGPYAPLLALENDLDVVIHMFGVAEADPELFEHFPITHLLLDENNEVRAREDYPALMDSARHVLTYHLGTDQVRLFRVAGHTDNIRARRYRPSLLEMAVDAYNGGEVGRGHALAAQYLEKYPDNISGYLAIGEVADAQGEFELASYSIAKAVEYSPTSYNLNSRLGQLYKDEYERTGEPAYRRLGLEYFEEAVRFAPGVPKLRQAYNELKRGRNSQVKEH